ncbi:vacuolar protein sorting-associated protein 72 homolog [Myxocyprinus asiaticus]|uniref:vacuolar protein sorting-associated protein 72 homolog n=1 Tax=Myxocyprinus asiaticus TaxID=70543 RepID=UPI002223C292|nr:vacuolar protein sorting-associated protein 72 homolog [Myxocyprinus asiaticus]
MKRQCVGSVCPVSLCAHVPGADVSLKEENVDVEGLDQAAQQNPSSHPAQTPQSDSISSAPPSALSNGAAVNAFLPPGAAKCSRFYITFSDDETFQRFFAQSQAPRINDAHCTILATILPSETNFVNPKGFLSSLGKIGNLTTFSVTCSQTAY